VPPLSHPEWLSVAQLVPDWAKELADATTSVHEVEDELRYRLEKDVTNGFLDDPRRDGSRLGLRIVGPAAIPGT
jgi:hypothetical protein